MPVLVAWSHDIHVRLTALGKTSALFEYPATGHSLRGRDYAPMMGRVTRFFRIRLMPANG